MGYITYSPEDRAKIDACSKIDLFGTLRDIDPKDYSTPEGIAKQLDRFTLPPGILYYVDKDLQMQKTSVYLHNFYKGK